MFLDVPAGGHVIGCRGRCGEEGGQAGNVDAAVPVNGEMSAQERVPDTEILELVLRWAGHDVLLPMILTANARPRPLSPRYCPGPRGCPRNADFPTVLLTQA